MPTLIAFAFLVLVQIGISAEEMSAPASTAPLTYGEISSAVDGMISLEPTKGKTALQNQAGVDRIIGKLKDMVDGKKITIPCAVEDVAAGSAGTVKLRLKSPSSMVGKQSPLSSVWNTDFVVRMPIDEAAAVGKGSQAVVNGTIAFYPKLWGAVGLSKHQQQLWILSRSDVGGSFFGTLTLSSWTVVVGGKEYQGVQP